MISRCSRQPLYPRGVLSLRPSGPSPSPSAFPRTPEAWRQGRCLADWPIGKRRKTVQVRTIRGLWDVTGAGPGRGGGGGTRGRSRGTRRPLSQPAAEPGAEAGSAHWQGRPLIRCKGTAPPAPCAPWAYCLPLGPKV